jgi:hypothetical protein
LLFEGFIELVPGVAAILLDGEGRLVCLEQQSREREVPLSDLLVVDEVVIDGIKFKAFYKLVGS